MRGHALSAMSPPLDRLLHWGIITLDQAAAGRQFARTMSDYLAAKGDAARATAFMEALRKVDNRDHALATAIVWDVCIAENDRMRNSELISLRSGLDAISAVVMLAAASAAA